MAKAEVDFAVAKAGFAAGKMAKVEFAEAKAKLTDTWAIRFSLDP